jgi:hypothetical protein
MVGAFHEIWQRTGHIVNVVCSEEFAPVFDGCSFVNAVSVPVRWDTGLPQMKQVAETTFGGGQVIQFWLDLESPEFKNKRGGISLQIHGINFSVDTSKDPHYSASMMRRAGFSWDEAFYLRPVFDQRSPEREAELVDRCWPTAKRDKPMLLVAFDGQSSPWGYMPEFYPVLQPFYRHFHVVDLGKLKSNRVFDLLVLMEAAVGLITVDTLALHLAAATDLPYIAFTAAGWVGSVPRGNCVLRIPYAETIRRLPDVAKVLERWKRERCPKPQMLVSTGG